MEILHVDIVVLLGPENKVISLWMGLGFPEKQGTICQSNEKSRLRSVNEDAQGGP